MHLHILGICGTFMGGIACLAREAGHVVSGSDSNVYPPMSTQLQALGIELLDIADSTQFKRKIDIVIVGNVMTRGMPAIEQLLNSKLPYTSGPQWLAENILRSRHVLAVAGTHGKTTTASMLAWVLENAGLAPGFLIGGVPADFDVSAQSGDGRYFVVEADEYDTAFFDKRSKFVHYRPDTLILNNLEYDHADIFDNLDQIEKQFHHLVRTVPGNGCIYINATDDNLARVMALGCWSRTQTFALDDAASDWTITGGALRTPTQAWHTWTPPMPGAHNASNALAAIAAASHVGVDCEKALKSLAEFAGVARRMQLYGEVNGVRVYDDFAHHPTAIAATLDGVRQQVGDARIIAVIEPRSNTMKRDIHTARLVESLRKADAVWLYADATLEWDPLLVVGKITNGHVVHTIESLINELVTYLAAGDHVVIMSNGGFGGAHARLVERLQA